MATNPYTSQASSGYNSSPPADDGSAVEANRIKWATILTKLSDVLKTFTEAVDTAVLAAFGKVINTDNNENNLMTGSLAFGDSELTISAGAVTATRSHHTIDTQSDAGTDDLDTIATGSVADGCLLFLRANNTARTVVLKHEAGGAGQLHLGADISLDDTNKSVILQRRGADWYLAALGQVASQANMEADDTADLLVTTGVFRNHPGVAKAFVLVDMTGTPAIIGSTSDNITGITGANTGKLIITLAIDMSTVNYVAAGMAGQIAADANHHISQELEADAAPAAGVFDCAVQNVSGSYVDVERNHVVFFGDR